MKIKAILSLFFAIFLATSISSVHPKSLVLVIDGPWFSLIDKHFKSQGTVQKLISKKIRSQNKKEDFNPISLEFVSCKETFEWAWDPRKIECAKKVALKILEAEKEKITQIHILTYGQGVDIALLAEKLLFNLPLEERELRMTPHHNRYLAQFKEVFETTKKELFEKKSTEEKSDLILNPDDLYPSEIKEGPSENEIVDVTPTYINPIMISIYSIGELPVYMDDSNDGYGYKLQINFHLNQNITFIVPTYEDCSMQKCHSFDENKIHFTVCYSPQYTSSESNKDGIIGIRQPEFSYLKAFLPCLKNRKGLISKFTKKAAKEVCGQACTRQAF